MNDAALTEAMGLLTGKDRPMDPARGAAALEALARDGDGEAAARAAVVAGAGFGRPQSWEAALDWLAAAAEAGHPDALAQLALLARQPGTQAKPGALRAGIDVAEWVRRRPAQLVVAAPRIGVAKGFLERDVCAWLIARAQPLQRRARVYNPATGQPTEHDTRSNTTALFTIRELDVPMLMVRARIANTLNTPVLNLERFSIFHYEPGQRFTRHVDYLDPAAPQFAEDLARHGQRAATFLVYLNDDFDGGETTFLSLGRKFKGGLGDAVFFYNVDANGAPDRLTPHEGSAPTRGEKWLLSQFVRDRAQLPG